MVLQGAGFECQDDESDGNKFKQPWNMDKLRVYISIVKDRFRPALGDEPAMLLERHYEKCRTAESSTIPVTVRFLESMIRLSQAHARLMYRNVVTLEDAVAVLRIMECSAFAYGGFDGNVDDFQNILYRDPMTVDFIDDPDTEFDGFMYRILDRYGMLSHMPSDRKGRGMEYLKSTNQTTGWQSLENTGEVATFVEEDHYGRHHLSGWNGMTPSPVKAKKRRKDW